MANVVGWVLRMNLAAWVSTWTSVMRCFPRSAYSHMIRTRQPVSKSSVADFLSLISLSLSFCRHKSFRVSGSFERAHLWRCQKVPWTNTTVRDCGKTRSGRPGRVLSCSRYLSPFACKPRLTSISGWVSRLRMQLILNWRYLALWTSVIPSLRTCIIDDSF